MQWPELVEAHLKGLKRSSVQQYRKVGRRFEQYLFRSQQKPQSVSSANVCEWLETLRTLKGITDPSGYDQLANRTIRKHLIVCKAIFASNIREGLDPTVFDLALSRCPISKNPQKRRIGYIKFNLVDRLFEALKDSASGRRNAAWLALGFGGGLRISESLNIRMGDIRRTEKGSLYVHLNDTKTNVSADQVIMRHFIPWIERYEQERYRDGAKPSDIFLTSHDNLYRPLNKSIGARHMQHYFEELTERVLGQRLTPHSMRATAISKLLFDGVPAKKVQEFARHSDLATTENYYKVLYQIDESPAINAAW